MSLPDSRWHRGRPTLLVDVLLAIVAIRIALRGRPLVCVACLEHLHARLLCCGFDDDYLGMFTRSSFGSIE